MTLFDELAHCRGWIEAALKHTHGTHTFDDIVAGCYTGRFRLWSRKWACVVTEIHDYPQKRAVNIFLAGGDLDVIRDGMPDVAEYAKAIGATELTMTGRSGWLRALASQGWAKSHVAMRLEI